MIGPDVLRSVLQSPQRFQAGFQFLPHLIGHRDSCRWNRPHVYRNIILGIIGQKQRGKNNGQANAKAGAHWPQAIHSQRRPDKPFHSITFVPQKNSKRALWVSFFLCALFVGFGGSSVGLRYICLNPDLLFPYTRHRRNAVSSLPHKSPFQSHN